jgi:hypothetical protein
MFLMADRARRAPKERSHPTIRYKRSRPEPSSSNSATSVAVWSSAVLRGFSVRLVPHLYRSLGVGFAPVPLALGGECSILVVQKVARLPRSS